MTKRHKPAPKGDYDVGYGRPPKRSQFQPGHSGNPKGRPKDRRNISTILEETLYRPVAITENGRKRKVPAIEAMLLGLLRKGLDGDLRAFDKLARFIPMLRPAADEDHAAEESAVFEPEHDAELLAEFAAMIREGEALTGDGEKRDEQ